MDKDKIYTEKDIAAYEGYLAREAWWVILLSGIAILVFGIVLLFWPAITVASLVLLFGITAIVLGVVLFIRSFFLIRSTRTWWLTMLEGIFGILAGIILLVWPVSSLIFALYFIGGWLIVSGIVEIAQGITVKSGMTIVTGILSLLLGFFIFFRPAFYAATALIFFIGFFAIFRGIALITSAIILKTSISR